MGNVTHYFKSRNVIYDKIEKEGEISFRKNDKKLLDDKERSITDKEFNNQIKKEISKFIYPIENIVLLAGAGASIVNDLDGSPDKNYGHTINMLAQAVDEVLNESKDLYSLDEMSGLCKYNISIKKDNDDEESTKIYNSDFILEDFLSKVLAYEEFIDDNSVKDKYIRTKKEILQTIIEKTSYSFDSEKHKHASLINILSNMIKTPERVSIVTTNYDTLFEEAAESLDFIIFDGFSFSSQPKFNIDLFDWSLVRPIHNIKSDKVEYKKQTINLLKIHGSLTWQIKDTNIIRQQKIISLNEGKPIMIFPSSNKYSHSYEKPYFELFSKFQELLKKPNTILITSGFSFADNHIAKMIVQAIKTSPSLSLLVTDFSIDPTSKNENWIKIENMMESGYKIAFLKATLDSDLISYFGGNTNDN